jgi:protein gp37
MIDQDRLDKGLYWQRVFKVNEGCTKCSPACDNCWSENETVMRCNHPNEKISSRAKSATNYPYHKSFTGHIVLRHDNLDLPLRIKKPAVFAVWNDLFHEDVPDEFIGAAYNVMYECQDHIFLILTKRADRMKRMFEIYGLATIDNVYHGVTVCSQAEADEKIPHLLQVPSKRFLSIEPMLGPINLRHIDADAKGHPEYCQIDCLTGRHTDMARPCKDVPVIHQVLLGGESGIGARPMHPEWVRGVRDQCQAADVPFYFKQWGEWAPPEVTFGVHIHNPYRRDWKDTATWFASQWMIGKEDINDDGYGDDDENMMWRIGKKKAGRTLDDQLHNDLIWKGQ